MTKNCIEMHHVSKKYNYHKRTSSQMLRDKIMQTITAPFTRSAPKKNTNDTFWALRDIDLNVQPGESIGLIGHNGAGKSTLLKLLARLTKPTTGHIRLRGRVGALLEVGTGFHPELSGRDNIFLNGALLGMKRHELLQKFDTIVDFANMSEFIDTPVKHYSSGMYMRLAFSVAAHLESDILLVDEVLSVGDARFQKQCLNKMHDLSQTGRTVIFVSHHMGSIVSLTQRALWLEQGIIRAVGESEHIVNAYMQDQAEHHQFHQQHDTSKASITHCNIKTSRDGNIQHVLESFDIHVQLYTPKSQMNTCLWIQILNQNAQPITQFTYLDSETPFAREPGFCNITCHIPQSKLYIGQYTLRVTWVDISNRSIIDKVEGVCSFDVVSYQIRDYTFKKQAATYIEEHTWHIQDQINTQAIA